MGNGRTMRLILVVAVGLLTVPAIAQQQPQMTPSQASRNITDTADSLSRGFEACIEGAENLKTQLTAAEHKVKELEAKLKPAPAPPSKDE